MGSSFFYDGSVDHVIPFELWLVFCCGRPADVNNEYCNVIDSYTIASSSIAHNNFWHWTVVQDKYTEYYVKYMVVFALLCSNIY